MNVTVKLFARFYLAVMVGFGIGFISHHSVLLAVAAWILALIAAHVEGKS